MKLIFTNFVYRVFDEYILMEKDNIYKVYQASAIIRLNRKYPRILQFICDLLYIFANIETFQMKRIYKNEEYHDITF